MVTVGSPLPNMVLGRGNGASLHISKCLLLGKLDRDHTSIARCLDLMNILSPPGILAQFFPTQSIPQLSSQEQGICT